MTLESLIDEADIEEDSLIREKDRTIKKRLEKYRNYKIEDGSSPATLKRYFQLIKTFYRHHEISIPYIPTVQLKKEYHEKYEDIPNKNHIKKAINSTKNTLEKAIILFMSSSGTSKNETLNLTIKDFIKATKDYHKNGSIESIINELSQDNNIIPLFSIIRKKTDYHYYTCCSGEATNEIIKYLKTRKNLNQKSKLFKINRTQFNNFFKRINEKNNWGKVAHYGFFRSHSLRKFHATTIEDKSLADALQGRKRDSVTESYYKQNPKRIKERYKEVVHKLMIFDKIDNINKTKKQKEINLEDLEPLIIQIKEIIKRNNLYPNT
jgi:hypothetical protein